MTRAQTRPLDTAAELRTITALTGQARQQAIGDFLLARVGLIRQIAVSLCRSNRLDLARDVEDLSSEVHIEAVLMFLEMDADPSKFTNFEGMLTARCRNKIAERVNSSEWTGLSGYSSIQKRRRLLYNTQKLLLTTEGVLYEGQELIDRHNARMLASRADAARQSVLATLDDLVKVEIRDYDPDQDHAVLRVSDESDSPLVPSEAITLIRLTVQACHEQSERLGRVAELFLGAHEHPITSGAEIAARLRISGHGARQDIVAVRDTARQILSDRFGITSI
jgi:hypothetical protein